MRVRSSFFYKNRYSNLDYKNVYNRWFCGWGALYLGAGAVGCPDNTEVHHEKRKSNVVCNASRSGIDLFRCQEG